MTVYLKTSYTNFDHSTSEYLLQEANKDFIKISPTNDLTKGMWTDKGLAIDLSLVDTQGGLVIHLNKKKKIKLDYAEVHDLLVLLRLWGRENKQEFKINKLSEIEEI